jgi:hypothetical protein
VHRPGSFGRRFIAVLAFVVALTCGLAAAVNVAIDPFGYFGFNQTGLFFNDERTFKLMQVRRYPHDALLLGDSRSAYVDPDPIRAPRFFNGAFAGASLEELIWFWEHYGTDARVVVIGMAEGDIGGEPIISEQFANRSWRDPFRYALSFELLQHSRDAVRRWRDGEPPTYLDNGARRIADKIIRQVGSQGAVSPLAMSAYVPGATPPNRAVRNLCADRRSSLAPAQVAPAVIERLGRMAELADRRGAKLILFLQPRHQEIIDQGTRGNPAARRSGPPEILTAAICHFDLAFFDLTETYSDPSYYWSSDHTHYFPSVGVSLLEEILRGSGVPVEVK